MSILCDEHKPKHYMQCSAGSRLGSAFFSDSRLRLANFSKLRLGFQPRLGGPEPVSLKKIAFTHINEIFDENKNPNNIIKFKKIKSSADVFDS
jgi:hypothetical protein